MHLDKILERFNDKPIDNWSHNIQLLNYYIYIAAFMT